MYRKINYYIDVSNEPLMNVHNFCIEQGLTLDIESLTIPLASIEYYN